MEEQVPASQERELKFVSPTSHKKAGAVHACNLTSGKMGIRDRQNCGSLHPVRDPVSKERRRKGLRIHPM